MSALANSRDEAASDFEAVYHEHFDFVWRNLRRLGVAESSLEDCAQDVFVIVDRRLDGFEGRSSMTTWLLAIVVRVVRTYRRTRDRRERKIRALASVPAPQFDEQLTNHDARQLLLRMLSELDHKKREIYVLVEIEGLCVVEVASELGVNENTLRTRLRAARKQMAGIGARILADERKRR